MNAHRVFAIDVRRIDWYKAFFDRHGLVAVEAILEACSSAPWTSIRFERVPDLDRAMSGWAYWAIYISGYLEFRGAGALADDNLYVRYLTEVFGPRGHDPGLSAVLEDPTAARERVLLRYRDFDAFLSARAGLARLRIDPVRLMAVTPPPQHAKVVFELGSTQPYPPSVVDGYHRIFLARLFDVPGILAHGGAREMSPGFKSGHLLNQPIKPSR